MRALILLMSLAACGKHDSGDGKLTLSQGRFKWRVSVDLPGYQQNISRAEGGQWIKDGEPGVWFSLEKLPDTLGQDTAGWYLSCHEGNLTAERRGSGAVIACDAKYAPSISFVTVLAPDEPHTNLDAVCTVDFPENTDAAKMRAAGEPLCNRIKPDDKPQI